MYLVLSAFTSSPINKVFNTPNFDTFCLITKHVDFKVSNLCFVLLNQYCSNDKIKKNKMGGAYRIYGEEERSIQVFVGAT